MSETVPWTFQIVNIVLVFYIYAMYFIGQKSCTLTHEDKHCPIPYKCLINKFNFMMIDGHIKILIWQ